MGTLGQNAKLGMRQLRRNPGFTATVVLTLALAIGADFERGACRSLR